MSTLRNHFVFLLDGSSSMGVIRDETIDAFNCQVTTLKQAAASTGQETRVSLYVFRGRVVSRVFFNADVGTLKPLTRTSYTTSGMTPMLDAIGQGIDEQLELPEAADKNSSFILICFTDGEENESQKYSERDVQKLLRQTNSTDRWTHCFLVPDEDGVHLLVNKWGIPRGNVQIWKADKAGARVVSQSVSSGISSFYTGRTAGQTKSSGFFVTSMAHVKDSDVKKLRDVAGEVTMWPVTKVEMISVFCERKSRKAYLKGAAFYELVEDETVQPNKQMLLMEKGGSAVYAGDEIRGLLGLTHGVNVRVRPGDHGKWRIFVQSTSLNRNTDPNTTMIYWEIMGHVTTSRPSRRRSHATP